MNSMRDVDTASVKSVVSACNDYLQALSVLCNAGVTLVRHFVDPQSVSGLVQPVRRDQASRARATWEETGRVTRNASWALRTGSLRSLEEWLSRQEEEEEEEEDEPENKSGNDDCMRVLELSKLLNSCLSAVLQLQHQFSAMVAPPNGVKGAAETYRQPPSPPNHRANNGQSLLDPSSALHSRQHHHGHGQQHHHHHHHHQMAPTSLAALAAYNNFAQQRRPSADDSNEEPDDDAVPPAPESLLVRRSSSPPPPPPGAALGRRWSVPGGDSALEEGWTREMQRRSGGGSGRGHQSMTHPRQQLPPPPHPEVGRAILGAGRRHTKKKGGCPVTKEELDEVLLSLWGPPKTSSPVGTRHPLSVLLPQQAPAVTSHDWLQPPPVTRSLHADAHRRGSWQGGLLTVTTSSSSPPPPPQPPVSPSSATTATTNGWAAVVHRPPPKTSPPRSPQPVSPSTLTTGAEVALPTVLDANADTEGAFSIGLDLVGTNLVASVRQRGGDIQERDATTPPDANKFSTENSDGCEEASRQNGSESGSTGSWQSNRQQRQPPPPPVSSAPVISNTAAFLSFAVDAANSGSTIWTPSSNDYASRPRGSFSYQIGP